VVLHEHLRNLEALEHLDKVLLAVLVALFLETNQILVVAAAVEQGRLAWATLAEVFALMAVLAFLPQSQDQL
jgi:hypothetical protein